MSRFHVFLSEQAHSGLLERPPYSISKVVRRLPTDPDRWQDVRPQVWKDEDGFWLTEGKPIRWNDEQPRYRRQITITDKAVDGLIKLAEAFCIENHQRPTRIMNAHSRVSALLEAIGLGWLKERKDDYGT